MRNWPVVVILVVWCAIQLLAREPAPSMLADAMADPARSLLDMADGRAREPRSLAQMLSRHRSTDESDGAPSLIKLPMVRGNANGAAESRRAIFAPSPRRARGED